MPNQPTSADYGNALAAVTAEVTRTDSKASTLLTAISLPLAALVAIAPSRHLAGAATALMSLGAAGLVAAMVMSLLVLRPRLSGAARGSWPHWAQCDDDALADDLGTGQRLELVRTLARIAHAKFGHLRWAIDVTIASVAVLAIAVVVAALT